jgi:hypothetical protein
MKLPKSTILKPQKLTELKPRIWASVSSFFEFYGVCLTRSFSKNREELFAVLPEMTGSKCINGVSWKLFDTPMILLDDKNEIFQVVRDSADILSLEVSMYAFLSRIFHVGTYKQLLGHSRLSTPFREKHGLMILHLPLILLNTSTNTFANLSPIWILSRNQLSIPSKQNGWLIDTQLHRRKIPPINSTMFRILD